jgi:hypothetical protein
MTTTITPEALELAQVAYSRALAGPGSHARGVEAAILAALPELLAAQPDESHASYALRALVAAGHVSQQKVDEALAIATNVLTASSAGGQEPVACPVAGEAARIETALRDALTYVGQRADGDLATLAERAEVWMRESRCLIDSLQKTIGFRDANIVSLEKQMDKLIDDRRDGSPAPAAVPVGHVSVIQQDANNYCLILRLLGMEDEGDPVAEVRQLVEARDSQPAAQGVDWQHIANEWADCACNGVQWIKNVRDFPAMAADALAEMQSNYDRIRAMQHQQKESGDV